MLGLISTSHTPEPPKPDYPSMNSFHRRKLRSGVLGPSMAGASVVFPVPLRAGPSCLVNTAMRSARACTLIVVWGTYLISNSPSSMAYFVI